MADPVLHDSESRVPVVKAAFAWAGVGVAEFLGHIGVNTWADAAALAAFLYSCILIGEWMWKRWKTRRDRTEG